MFFQMAEFHSFWWPSSSSLCVCMCVCVCVYTSIYIHACHIFFIRSSITESFHILAIVNNAAVNIGVHVSFQISVFVSFIHPRVELLGHVVVLFGVCWESMAIVLPLLCHFLAWLDIFRSLKDLSFYHLGILPSDRSTGCFCIGTSVGGTGLCSCVDALGTFGQNLFVSWWFRQVIGKTLWKALSRSLSFTPAESDKWSWMLGSLCLKKEILVFRSSQATKTEQGSDVGERCHKALCEKPDVWKLGLVKISHLSERLKRTILECESVHFINRMKSFSIHRRSQDGLVKIE